MPDARCVTTIKALLGLFASTDRIAALVGAPYTMVAGWERRGRVPRVFWGRLVAAARDSGIKGVSFSLLERLPSAKNVDTVAELFDLWPSLAALARDLELHHGTVRSWAVRNSIPVEHWAGVMMSAGSNGIRHLTEARLRTMATARRKSIRSTSGQIHGEDSSLCCSAASGILHNARFATSQNVSEQTHAGVKMR